MSYQSSDEQEKRGEQFREGGGHRCRQLQTHQTERVPYEEGQFIIVPVRGGKSSQVRGVKGSVRRSHLKRKEIAFQYDHYRQVTSIF